MAKNYKTIPMSEVRARYNPGPGRHWFDRGTMRFFRTKLPTTAYEGPGGTFFVSSEQSAADTNFGPFHKRRWTVRKLVKRESDGNYDIETCGGYDGFQRYMFPEDAREEAKKMASAINILD